MRRNPNQELPCVSCGLIGCPCGCNGDSDECVCDIEVRSNPYACAACGLIDCPGGCDGDPDACVCDIEVRRNPVCGKCGIEDCECQIRGYCVCDKRRNPDPDGNPWGPSLYNPFEDDYHRFKDDSSYRRIASRFRRNPWIDIGDEYE